MRLCPRRRALLLVAPPQAAGPQDSGPSAPCGPCLDCQLPFKGIPRSPGPPPAGPRPGTRPAAELCPAQGRARARVRLALLRRRHGAPGGGAPLLQVGAGCKVARLPLQVAQAGPSPSGGARRMCVPAPCGQGPPKCATSLQLPGVQAGRAAAAGHGRAQSCVPAAQQACRSFLCGSMPALQVSMLNLPPAAATHARRSGSAVCSTQTSQVGAQAAVPPWPAHAVAGVGSGVQWLGFKAGA